MADISGKDLAYRTLAAALGGPVDLTTMVMRPFGYNVGKPVLGSEWIGQKLQDVGWVSDVRNPTAEFLASLAIPGPGELAAVGKGAMAVPALLGMTKAGGKAGDALQIPKVLYHGTSSPEKFTSFDSARIGEVFGKKLQDQGFWFTDSKSQAHVYASENRDRLKHARIMEASIDLKNPAIWGATLETRTLKGPFVKAAKEAGHDGVIFKGIDDGTGYVADQYLVFNKDAIKVLKP